MSAHVVESTSELSAFIKGGVMAANAERDAGFCSGGDEDDNMSGLHSPSASEDSVEVQVTPISLRNKRKLAEPRKIQEPNMAPLKKRRFELVERETTPPRNLSRKKSLDIVQDEESRPASSPSPFRPWSTSGTSKTQSCGNSVVNERESVSTESKFQSSSLNSQEDSSQESTELGRREQAKIRLDQESRWIREENKRREEEVRRRYEARIEEEVLSRLQESENRRDFEIKESASRRNFDHHRNRPISPIFTQLPARSGNSNIDGDSSNGRQTRTKGRSESNVPARLQEEPLALVLRGENSRVPSHPGVNGTASYSPEMLNSPTNRQRSNHPRNSQAENHQQQQQQQQQRNYKNMTRERRIEANARERTRVHTISAAFDTLRRAVPAYSNNQKLSKLSVLRIACSYIMTLSNIANTPQGEPPTSASLGACVDLVSRTIQTEGKLRKKKDE